MKWWNDICCCSWAKCGKKEDEQGSNVTSEVVTSGGTRTEITKSGQTKVYYSEAVIHKTHTIQPTPTRTITTSKTLSLEDQPKAPSNKKDSSGFSEFEKECLDEHNKLRAKHGCPPLKLNRELCEFSKAWAKNLASWNTLKHRTNSKYGENLYMSSGMMVDGRTAVKSWYDEIQDYNFGSGSFSMSTGHFTQVVWKNSKELGVGFEKRGDAIYVVANYDPPGNYSGEYDANVPRLRY